MSRSIRISPFDIFLFQDFSLTRGLPMDWFVVLLLTSLIGITAGSIALLGQL